MTRLSRLSASPLSSRRPRPGAGMAGWRGAGPGLLRLSRIDRIRDDRHPGLEDPEDGADPQPGLGVHAGHADADGRGQVSEPDCDRGQEERDHGQTITGGAITAEALVPAPGIPALTAL